MVASKERQKAPTTPQPLLWQLRKEVNEIVFEREDEVDGILSAILAQEHCVLIGPKGAAKSLVINLILSAFDGAKVFKKLLHSHLLPEKIFGAISLHHWKQTDEQIINTAHRLPEADFANLEEIFNLPPEVLETMHLLFNEREFENPLPIKCPLNSALGSANELPPKNRAGALLDRILLKYVVGYLQNPDHEIATMMRMASGFVPQVKTRITMADLRQLQAEAMQVRFDKEMAESIVKIKQKLKDEIGFAVSDRTRDKLVTLLKAYAYLQGDSAVSEDHFGILVPALWEDDIGSIGTIRKVVTSCANPVITKAQEMADRATNLVNGVGSSPVNGNEDDRARWQIKGSGVIKQLGSIVAELQDIQSNCSASTFAKIQKHLETVEGYRTSLNNEMLKELGIS